MVLLTNLIAGLLIAVLFSVFMASMHGVGWAVGELPEEQRLLRQRSMRRAWACIVLTFVVSIVAFAVLNWGAIGAALAGLTLGVVQVRMIRARVKALANRQRRLERTGKN